MYNTCTFPLLQVNFCPFGLEPTTQTPRTAYYGLIRHHDIIEPYRPDRVLRQLGRVQRIPSPIQKPTGRVCRPSDPRRYLVEHSSLVMEQMWNMFPASSHITLQEYPLAASDRMQQDGYLTWYQEHSHPFVIHPDHVEGASGDQRHMDESVCLLFSV